MVYFDFFLFQSAILLMSCYLIDMFWLIFFWEYFSQTLLEKHISEVKSKDWEFQHQAS